MLDGIVDGEGAVGLDGPATAFAMKVDGKLVLLSFVYLRSNLCTEKKEGQCSLTIIYNVHIATNTVLSIQT